MQCGISIISVDQGKSPRRCQVCFKDYNWDSVSCHFITFHLVNFTQALLDRANFKIQDEYRKGLNHGSLTTVSLLIPASMTNWPSLLQFLLRLGDKESMICPLPQEGTIGSVLLHILYTTVLAFMVPQQCKMGKMPMATATLRTMATAPLLSGLCRHSGRPHAAALKKVCQAYISTYAQKRL